MTETSTTLPRRRWWKIFLVLFAVVCVAALGLVLYANTDSFQSMVRRRMVAELERVTGGRVEIGSIHTTPFLLQVDVRGITVHGTEAGNEIPLAHIERITARLKFNFLLRSELAFREINLEQPVVHVIFYPGGSTNFPSRAIQPVSTQNPVERLFALSINHFVLRHGRLLWDDQTIPLDFDARDTSLQMDYSFFHQRYDGHLQLGQVETRLLDYRPFAWLTAVEFSLASNAAVIPSIKWNSGHSHFQASGQLTDFRHPTIQGQYEGHIDLAEAASIARRHDLKAGMLDFKGHGEGNLSQFSVNGFLDASELVWQDSTISFSKAALSAGYSVSDRQLKISKLQGKIFDGAFSGDGEINQWLAPMQHLSPATRKAFETATISASHPANTRNKTAKPNPQPIQNAVIALHLRDLSAELLANALSAPGRPVRELHPAALASGTLETRWQGTPHDAQIQFALDLVPPPHVTPPQRALATPAAPIPLPAVHWISRSSL